MSPTKSWRVCKRSSSMASATTAGNLDRALELGEIARRFGLRLLRGDTAETIRGICAIEPGAPAHVAYAGGRAQAAALAKTQAAAVIVPEALANDCPVATLVAEQPQLAFARLAALFERVPTERGRHASAVVHPDARLDAGVTVGANVVIGAGCVLGSGTRIEPGCVLGDDVVIGNGGLIASNVSIHAGVHIGANVRIEANAAIGARGFGLVHNGHGWEPIPQLGGVRIGEDVEIGAGTTIDRGTISDTVIGDNVKIDNQVHIGHNCSIGAHTVIAGCTGIAGSCTIGANCLIGGGVGIGDHVRVADNVAITAASQVPKNIDQAGAWSSTFRAMPAGEWRKRLAYFRKLNQMDTRLKRIERTRTSRGEKQ